MAAEILTVVRREHRHRVGPIAPLLQRRHQIADAVVQMGQFSVVVRLQFPGLCRDLGGHALVENHLGRVEHGAVLSRSVKGSVGSGEADTEKHRPVGRAAAHVFHRLNPDVAVRLIIRRQGVRIHGIELALLVAAADVLDVILQEALLFQVIGVFVSQHRSHERGRQLPRTIHTELIVI